MNMPLNTIATTLLSQFKLGPTVQQVSQQLGISSDQANQAITAALPLLLNAIGTTSGQPSTLGQPGGALGQLLGEKTGLDTSKAGQLLGILAPLATSFMAQHSGGQASGQATPSGTSDLTNLLGKHLDQDGDGKFGVGDVLGLLGGKR